jgi:glycosyl hydrolase family 45/cellulose binding protein with CBM1 domain
MPELLKDGCQWRFDWFKNADNPDIEFEQVQCPKEIVAVSGCVRDDDSTFPVFNGGSASSNKPSTTSKAAAQPASSSATKAAADTSAPQQQVENKTTAVQSTQTPAAVTPVKPDSSVTTSSKAPSIPASKPSTSAGAPVSKPTSAVRVALWGQCDSKASWEKPLKCERGSKCVYVNDWYSQCQPKNSCA